MQTEHADSKITTKNGSLDNNPNRKVGQSQGENATRGCENLSGAYFICKQGHSVFRTFRCNARFEVDCPDCAYKWRIDTIRRFRKRISVMLFPALVTLTLRKGGAHSLEELTSLVHRIRKYLRRAGYDIRGFVSCLELPNHIHCVWDCNYIPQKKLSEVWRTVTGDSYIVDIRAVDNRRGAGYYISKYITQICADGSAVSLYGVRVVNSFGKSGASRKKVRMACKICGSPFEALWYVDQVDTVVNDPVNFVEVEDYG